MINDYPIYNGYFGNSCVSQYNGCRREQEFFRPCSCHQNRPYPPLPPFPPFPPFPPAEFALHLRKLDACSNNPLAGATFELTRDGVVVGAASSPASGEITFAGLLPGKYILRETGAPPNYRQDLTLYEVDIFPNGAVAVNGDITRNFIVRNYLLDASAPPQVNPVSVASDTVGGTGITGCTINVIWPDGETGATSVNGGGTWAVSKPDALVLQPGDLIRVTQTCSQHLPSETVYIGVTL